MKRKITNGEFRSLVREAVDAVLTSQRDERLPDLTPEQLHFWFQQITVEDIREALPDLHVTARAA